MESPYINSVMKEEGDHECGGRGPTGETLCQCDRYPEILWQVVIPSHLLQGGQWQIELLLYFVATFPVLTAAARSHLSCSAPRAAASLQSDKTSLLSAKPDALQGFCHHTVSARSISYIQPVQLSQKRS